MEKIVDIVIGYCMIFCFFNMKQGRSRDRYGLYYAIFYLENFAILILWYCMTPELDEEKHIYSILSVVGGFVTHMSCQVMYYMCCHPTENIKAWAGCGSQVVTESLFQSDSEAEEEV